MLGCDNPPALPPILPPGDAGSTAICEPGDTCNEGTYCVAVAGSGCSDLECVGGTWSCVPDSGPNLDSGAPPDATTPDATTDAPIARDAAGDAPSDVQTSGQ
jgi:hypothetical protein